MPLARESRSDYLHHYAAAAALVVVAKTRAVAHDEANPRNLPIHYAEMVLYAREMCICIYPERASARGGRARMLQQTRLMRAIRWFIK
jgi:hypothetical protein